MKTAFLKNKQGLSLIEMMISIGIMVAISAMISIFVIRSFYVNRHSIERGVNLSILQNALRNFSKNLREAKQADNGAYLIQEADDFEIIFFCNNDDDDATEKLHYFLEDGQLKLGVSEGSGFPITYPGTDQEVRIIADGVINGADQPIFFYYNKDYPADQDNNPIATPASPLDISAIQIQLIVDADSEQAPNYAQMETFVRPRNISSQ